MYSFCFWVNSRNILLYIIFLFIVAYFSRQSDTGTIDDVIWVWCSLSEKLLDLFNGNKTKQKMIGSLSKLLLDK